METNDKAIGVLWFPADVAPALMAERKNVLPFDAEDLPDVRTPGITVWIVDIHWAAVQLDHWLLCLTFLIAAVVTGWRWKTAVTDRDTVMEAET